MTFVQTGIERLAAAPPRALEGKRLGLLANPAAVDRRFRHSRFILDSLFPGQLTALFTPQHGFFADKQDNMIPSRDMTDSALNIPVFSLYGDTRIPSKAMLDHVDTLIVDLQDVGTRVYTFIYTMALCMEAARACNKAVVVLDRPNPVGGFVVEGNCLKPELASFVGMYPIPMRHGLTIGELALLFNEHFGIHCDLTVVSMGGWRREMFFLDTGLPWIPPSPNLPTPGSAIVYPGQVLWEGTNVSEGRGTTQPFEVFGAPFFDTTRIAQAFAENQLPGFHLRPLAFEPTSNKWTGNLCFGFQIHVTQTATYRPYHTTLALLQAVYRCHPDSFAWKSPPYEYEFEKLPFDLIAGDEAVREAIEKQKSLEALEEGWREKLASFGRIRKDCLLYK